MIFSTPHFLASAVLLIRIASISASPLLQRGAGHSSGTEAFTEEAFTEHTVAETEGFYYIIDNHALGENINAHKTLIPDCARNNPLDLSPKENSLWPKDRFVTVERKAIAVAKPGKNDWVCPITVIGVVKVDMLYVPNAHTLTQLQLEVEIHKKKLAFDKTIVFSKTTKSDIMLLPIALLNPELVKISAGCFSFHDHFIKPSQPDWSKLDITDRPESYGKD